MHAAHVVSRAIVADAQDQRALPRSRLPALLRDEAGRAAQAEEGGHLHEPREDGERRGRREMDDDAEEAERIAGGEAQGADGVDPPAAGAGGAVAQVAAPSARQRPRLEQGLPVGEGRAEVVEDLGEERPPLSPVVERDLDGHRFVLETARRHDPSRAQHAGLTESTRA